MIGFNRGEHGRPAGLRTSMLVCLAASAAMIQANLLLDVRGKASDSFVVLDLMRFPLGILSGMGFIGGGAILKRGNMVQGVTTAATLWFLTIMGLCFGGGQIGLGVACLLLGMIILSLLKQVDEHMTEDRRATISAVVAADGPSRADVCTLLSAAGFSIASCGVAYNERQQLRRIHFEVRWRGKPTDAMPPQFVDELAARPGVQELRWRPWRVANS